MWSELFDQPYDPREFPVTEDRPRIPRQLASWCMDQPPDRRILDEGATVDLTWWNERIHGQGLDITIMGRGPDGDLVDHGEAEITRSDLLRCLEWDFCTEPDRYRWAGTRQSSTVGISPEGQLMMLYMCSAWAAAHRRRDFPKRFPSFVDASHRDRPVYVHAGPMLAVEGAAEPEIAYGRIMGLGNEGFLDADRDELPRKAPGMTWRLGTLFLANASWLDPSTPLVPMSRATMYMLIRLGFTGFSFNRDPSIRDYCAYQQTIHNWAADGMTWPELIEVWLTNRWYSLDGPRSMHINGVR